MGKLANLKYELIAQEVVKGATPEEACLAAGLKGDRSNAWRIVRRPEVTARVAELQAKAADKALVTVEALGERLFSILERLKEAEDAPRLSVERQTVMDLAKLFGMIKDKTELSGDPKNPIRTETRLDMTALSEEQLRALSSIKVG